MRIILQDKKHENLYVSICEFPPAARNIKILNDLKGKIVNYFLSFPYIQIAIVKETMKANDGGGIFVGMTRTPFCPNTNSKCYVPTLPNCYEDFHVCGIGAKNLKEAGETFWNSNFHDGGYAGSNYLVESSMKNLAVWQKMTTIAPEFILSEGCNYGKKNKLLPFIETIVNGYEPEDYDDYDYERDYDDDDGDDDGDDE